MLYYTKHAIEKMDALGIEAKEVKQVIAKGMKWKEETREIWHAQMSGTEVVFAKQDGDFIIITVYLAKG